MKRNKMTPVLRSIVLLLAVTGTVLPSCGCTAEEVLALVLDSVAQVLSADTTSTSS